MNFIDYEIKSFYVPMWKEEGAFSYQYKWVIEIARNPDKGFLIKASDGSRAESFDWVSTEATDMQSAFEEAVKRCKQNVGID